ncbi:MAG: molybdopterin-dependent oxidoreductase [Hyphomicrobiales bacterium]|nr:molybdopterin-dependent oxidoreductase [Hyphomicrobiales bacterium]
MHAMVERAAATGQQSTIIPTACGMCYVGCGILVETRNGVVVNIEGNPASPQNRGNMCAKGKAGIMSLYNPNRVTVPLKRTNPSKGHGEDPGFQPISWDEAFTTIAANLERIRDNPKKLLIHAWETVGDCVYWLKAFGAAFGTPHITTHGSPTCGKVVHPVEYFSGGGFHQQADLHYANYCLLVGTQLGVAARGSFNHLTLDMAEARARGMKLVVVDPVGGYAASKANEWIPVRPGTDAALALSMLHVLLNEERVYDEPFLKHKTNAPYLVGADGRYLRDADKKPLIHDAADGVVKPYDDPSLRDPAITGTHEVSGRQGRTAFDLLREHVAKYPPERTEAMTTIPAATSRRIAREFGAAARIGETITIDGVELPYRPACVDWAKGTQGHKHGFHQCWPLKLLNIVIGAVNVPGGIMSTGARGERPHHWAPAVGTDGLLEDGGHILPLPHAKAFPGRKPTLPVRADVTELFPLATHSHTMLPVIAENRAAYGLTYGVEMMMHSPTNALLGTFGDVKKMEELYRSLKFVVGFAVEINETTLFDDIVLPFPSALERCDFNAGQGEHSTPPCGHHDFQWQVRLPAVKPAGEIRYPQEVMQEIGARLGLLGDMYRVVNHTFMLKGENRLEDGRRYNAFELVDRTTKSWFGPERDLAWFRKHGLITLPKHVTEAYYGPFLNARLPIYLEHFIDRGEELKQVLDSMGLCWDLSDYKPLSEFLPCPSYHAVHKGEYDLIAVHFKLPFTYGSYGNENPWVDEICERTRVYDILLNEAVGKAKGIRDGDTVWLESPVQKVRATVKLTQCIHPQAVGVAGHFGHWSKGMPVARGKGVNFNGLLPTDVEHIDLISSALDHCVEVKVYRDQTAPPRITRA